MVSIKKSKIKSLEDIAYSKFFILQWILFVASIAKSTALGFITYKLNLTTFELAIFACVSTLGALGSFIFAPLLNKKARNIELFFVSTQILNVLFTLIGLGYSIWCYFNGNVGTFSFWLFINFLICLSIYIEPTARSIYVKKRFPNFDFTSIAKSDVMTMGLAKIIGFGAGIFITSTLSVVIVFALGLVACCIFWLYLLNQVKKRPHRKIQWRQSANKKNEEKNNYSYFVTLMILYLNALFLTPINTQSVTYSKEWDIPFYIFMIVSSSGNIFFSLFVNKHLDLSLSKGFTKYIVLTFLGFSLLNVLPGILSLIGFFILGGVNSTMHVLSNARLFSSQQGKSTRAVSFYYLQFNILFAIGSLILGVLLNYYSINVVFSIYAVVTVICFCLIKMYIKKHVL